MIKQLCSFMFGGHKECEERLHKAIGTQIGLLNQIQELKAINNYQTYELERKIKELELHNAELLGQMHDLEEAHGNRLKEFHTSEYELEYENGVLKEHLNLRIAEVEAREKRIKELEEFSRGKIFECLDLQTENSAIKDKLETLQHECDEEYQKNERLHERLQSSQNEVSTLSGVLSSEPIMEALGKKDE